MNPETLDQEERDLDSYIEARTRNRQLRREVGEPRGRKSRRSSRERIRMLRKAHTKD